MKLSPERSIECLLERFPAFQGNWQAHLEYWKNVTERPYGLDVAEFVGFVRSLIVEGQETELQRVADFLEEMLTQGDEQVQWAFRLMFLESLTNNSKLPLARFVSKLLPRSRQALKEMDEGWGTHTPGM